MHDDTFLRARISENIVAIYRGHSFDSTFLTSGAPELILLLTGVEHLEFASRHFHARVFARLVRHLHFSGGARRS
jgi:hypothetical protein